MPSACFLNGWGPTVVGAIAAFVVLAVSFRVHSRLDAIVRHQRALRLQVSNLLSMLRRAGFKIDTPGKPDWSDDYLKTQLLKEDEPWKWKR